MQLRTKKGSLFRACCTKGVSPLHFGRDSRAGRAVGSLLSGERHSSRHALMEAAGTGKLEAADQKQGNCVIG